MRPCKRPIVSWTILSALGLLSSVVAATPDATLTPAPVPTVDVRVPPSVFDRTNAPMSLLERNIGLSSLDRRQSCYPQGKCSGGVCCPLDGTCCDDGKVCCQHTEWCNGYAICCNRWEIACTGVCCYPGNGGCCGTTRLQVTDPAIKYNGLGWTLISSTCNDSGATSKVTSQSDTSITYTFRGTGIVVNAARSRYTVYFLGYDYYLTERNTTTACDIGYSRVGLPCQEYTITIYPDTRAGQFELSGISIIGASQCPIRSSTRTSSTATHSPTQSSGAQEIITGGWASWVVSAVFGLLLNV